MKVETYKCDGCGRTKTVVEKNQIDTQWFCILPSSTVIHISLWAPDNSLIGWLDICGEECLHKEVSKHSRKLVDKTSLDATERFVESAREQRIVGAGSRR
jgi:hypothetical protein